MSRLFGAVESFRKVNVMTEPNNRVFGRRGARALTEAEIGEVGGLASGPIITDVLTMFGRDFQHDVIENQ
jgi:hypothetical protein